MNGLSQITDIYELVRYFPIVLNLLFHVLCNRKPPVAMVAFTSIVDAVDKVFSLTLEKGLLESYLAHSLKHNPEDKKLLCEEIVECWLKHVKLSSQHLHFYFLFLRREARKLLPTHGSFSLLFQSQ